MKSRWRGPILLAAGSALLVAAIQYGAFTANNHELLLQWLGGVVAGQFTVLALWAAWSSQAAWKRMVLVLAYMGLPTYFVLAREWWVGGTLSDAFVFYLGDSLLLLALTAVLIPVRWTSGYQLFDGSHQGTSLQPGRFRLAELFGLTMIVAGALTILVPGGAGKTETNELFIGATLLSVVLGSVIALLFPSARVMLAPRLSALWFVMLLLYLIAVIIAASELFLRLFILFKSPSAGAGFPDFWEFRGWEYLIGAGFSMSLLPTLLLWRLFGFRLMIGQAAAGKMTACETARC